MNSTLVVGSWLGLPGGWWLVAGGWSWHPAVAPPQTNVREQTCQCSHPGLAPARVRQLLQHTKTIYINIYTCTHAQVPGTC